MTRRNLDGKIIPKAKFGATGKTYLYRVDVNPSLWMNFDDENAARKYHAQMGGKIVKWTGNKYEEV